MPKLEEASPICRGKNLSWETILLFYNNMPRVAMPKAKFHAYTEAKISGWTTTHSQIARQLAFYHEKEGICYPRFTQEMSYADLFKYMQNWAAKYFIPNPFAPSLKDYTPTCIYQFVIESVNSGEKDFDTILNSIFNISLSSHDKVKVYLNNFTNLIINNSNEVAINNRSLGGESILHPDITYAKDTQKYFDYFTTESELFKITHRSNNMNSYYQKIFYGAPGTGKSHEISLATSKDNSIRTTFHPDSDYSTFVGAYKPIEEIRPRYGLNQDRSVRMVDENNNPLNEKTITYNFVPQAFIKAYTEAWYRYAKWQNEEGEKEAAPETYYLIIEEINRGNCAQIFGDLFQLLDREGNGFSSYAISPDNDIQLYLGGTEFSIKEKKWGLKGIDLKGDFYNDEENVIASAEEIISGELMLLPPNLFIWATMNTSDQSLFPIDSAFKRRWDWKYMPINKPDGKDHKILVNENEYDWWDFIRSINDVVESTTRSEDKKLGYFFCKARENIISADALVSKAFFYLWNDVFRDYGFKNDIFKRDENKRFVFQDFFLPDGKINEPVAEQFVKQVIARLNPETPTITE